MKFKIIQDSEKFFDLKTRAQKVYSKLLDHHPAKDFQAQFEVLLEDMLKIAEIHNALYFIERIRSIQSKYQDLKKSKFLNSSQANRIHSLFKKIDETENAYFLNSVLNNKLEKIIRKSYENTQNNKLHCFFVLSFQSSLIIVPKTKKKILSNVEYSTKYISLNNKKIRIFPISPLKVEYPEELQEKSNILILQSNEEAISVRFDSGLAEIYLDTPELEERKIETFSQYEDLKYFLKWRGRNCFYLDFPSSSHPFT